MRALVFAPRTAVAIGIGMVVVTIVGASIATVQLLGQAGGGSLPNRTNRACDNVGDIHIHLTENGNGWTGWEPEDLPHGIQAFWGPDQDLLLRGTIWCASNPKVHNVVIPMMDGSQRTFQWTIRNDPPVIGPTPNLTHRWGEYIEELTFTATDPEGQGSLLVVVHDDPIGGGCTMHTNRQCTDMEGKVTLTGVVCVGGPNFPSCENPTVDANGNYVFTFNARLIAIDNANQESSKTFTWTVIDTPPSLPALQNRVHRDGDPVDFVINGTDAEALVEVCTDDPLPPGVANGCYRVDSYTGAASFGGIIDCPPAGCPTQPFVIRVYAVGSSGMRVEKSFTWTILGPNDPDPGSSAASSAPASSVASSQPSSTTLSQASSSRSNSQSSKASSSAHSANPSSARSSVHASSIPSSSQSSSAASAATSSLQSSQASSTPGVWCCNSPGNACVRKLLNPPAARCPPQRFADIDESVCNANCLQTSSPATSAVSSQPSSHASSHGTSTSGSSASHKLCPSGAVCYVSGTPKADGTACIAASIRMCPDGSVDSPTGASCFVNGCAGACYQPCGGSSQSSASSTRTCGDGIRAYPPEQCDDGNTVNGDGCSAGCLVERGWRCLRTVPSAPAATAPTPSPSIFARLTAFLRAQLVEPASMTLVAQISGTPLSCDGAPACPPGQIIVCPTQMGSSVLAPLTAGPSCAYGLSFLQLLLNGCAGETTAVCAVGGPSCYVYGHLRWIYTGPVQCRTPVSSSASSEAVSSAARSSRSSAGTSSVGSSAAASSVGNALCETLCGDGIRAGNEQCDDRNTSDGDGCSGSCKLESGCSCTITGLTPGAGTSGPQCSDGSDNDGDGRVDAADPGCTYPEDDEREQLLDIVTCSCDDDSSSVASSAGSQSSAASTSRSSIRSSASSVRSGSNSSSSSTCANSCSLCGTGLFNLCDQAECAGLGPCLFMPSGFAGTCTVDEVHCAGDDSSSSGGSQGSQSSGASVSSTRSSGASSVVSSAGSSASRSSGRSDGSASSTRSSTSSATSSIRDCNRCSQCGAGLFNACDQVECLGLGSCLFTSSLLITSCTADPQQCGGSSSSGGSQGSSVSRSSGGSQGTSSSQGSNASSQGSSMSGGSAGSKGSGGSSSVPFCGNGRREAQEGCDDGNTRNGDGCSSICAIEDGWDCRPTTIAFQTEPGPSTHFWASLVGALPMLTAQTGGAGTGMSCTPLVTTYPMMPPSDLPTIGGIVGPEAGPDGNIWFVLLPDKIAKMTPSGSVTEYAMPPRDNPNQLIAPRALTAGPDGNVWFTLANINRIGKVTPTGTVTEYDVGGWRGYGWEQPGGIASGPDGNLWVTERLQIARVTPSGTVTEFRIPDGSSLYDLWEITAGSDGNMWFIMKESNKIGKITPSGVITTYDIPRPRSNPEDIVLGADGNIWFTEQGNMTQSIIGRITPSGSITEFPLPAGFGVAQGLTLGPDHRIWFGSSHSGIPWIANIDCNGTVQIYEGITAGDFAAGSDGRLWFSKGTGLGALIPCGPASTCGGGATESGASSETANLAVTSGPISTFTGSSSSEDGDTSGDAGTSSSATTHAHGLSSAVQGGDAEGSTGAGSTSAGAVGAAGPGGSGTSAAVGGGSSITRVIDICSPICGDGKVVGGEECDDGNKTSGDGCSVQCRKEGSAGSAASNASLSTGSSGSQASPASTASAGSFGSLSVGSAGSQWSAGSMQGSSGSTTHLECRGNQCVVMSGIGTTQCTTDDQCTGPAAPGVDTRLTGAKQTIAPGLPRCGDGIVQAPEACDDGNAIDTDQCTVTCRRRLEQPCTNSQECESGLCIGGRCQSCVTDSQCRGGRLCLQGTCVRCGDAIVTPPEKCDDGNAVNTDGCTNRCQMSTGYECLTHDACASGLCVEGICRACGSNGACGSGRQCVQGACVADRACSVDDDCLGNDLCIDRVCTPCGDGVVTPPEQCDDGNRRYGDGCSDTCRFEKTAPPTLAATNVDLPFMALPLPSISIRPWSNSNEPASNLPADLSNRPAAPMQNHPFGVSGQYGGELSNQGPELLAILAAGAGLGVAWARRRRL